MTQILKVNNLAQVFSLWLPDEAFDSFGSMALFHRGRSVKHSC